MGLKSADRDMTQTIVVWGMLLHTKSKGANRDTTQIIALWGDYHKNNPPIKTNYFPQHQLLMKGVINVNLNGCFS